MRHLTIRDILEIILFAVGFLALCAIVGFLETAPITVAIWVAASASILLWIAYVFVTAYQRSKEAARRTLWIMHNGQWVAADGSGRTKPGPQIVNQRRTPQPIFDYDA